MKASKKYRVVTCVNAKKGKGVVLYFLSQGRQQKWEKLRESRGIKSYGSFTYSENVEEISAIDNYFSAFE